jgi:3-phosphoshikimate 1-carboxyvinyltransferase
MRARIHPARRPLVGQSPIRVPGDKSISHRALLFGALASGECRIAGLAGGADVRSTTRVLAQLGVPVLRGDGTPWTAPPRSELAAESGPSSYAPPERPAGSNPLPARDPEMGPDDAIVLGGGLRGFRRPTGPLDCGNSGTTIRLLSGILAGAGVEATLFGDASLSSRPMERVATPLRALGASIDTTNGKAPIHLRGGHVRPGAIASKVASAQVKSAVLLAGLYAAGETSFTEPDRSRDHTERMLRFCGVDVRSNGNTVIVKGPAQLKAFAFDVPGDVSSAAFLVAAALIGPEGSELVLEHVGVNPTRIGFLDALSHFGAQVKLGFGPDGKSEPGRPGSGYAGEALEPVARITARNQKLRGAELDEALVLRAIDEVPILSVLGALAEGKTTIRGAGELRVKESDRLAKMAEGLRAMGAGVEELPDGLVLAGLAPGQKLRGAEIDSAHDHRIALAFAIAALAAEGPTTISGAEWADVSYPGFFSLLRRLGAEVELLP